MGPEGSQSWSPAMSARVVVLARSAATNRGAGVVVVRPQLQQRLRDGVRDRCGVGGGCSDGAGCEGVDTHGAGTVGRGVGEQPQRCRKRFA